MEGDPRLGEKCPLAAYVPRAVQIAPPTRGVVLLSGVLGPGLKNYPISITWPCGEKLKSVFAARTQGAHKTVPTED
jgi:hypothetical protein